MTLRLRVSVAFVVSMAMVLAIVLGGLEQLYRLVSQMRRYADKPQSDYFVHSAKVLSFVGDLRTIVMRLEEQIGMEQP